MQQKDLQFITLPPDEGFVTFKNIDRELHRVGRVGSHKPLFGFANEYSQYMHTP